MAVTVSIVQRADRPVPHLEVRLRFPLRGHADRARADHGHRFLIALSALLDREARR